MESLDEEVTRTLAGGDDDSPAWLFTVASTWGSSPRPPGSLLAIDANGRQTGSVSGGCVEDDLLTRVRNHEFERDCPRIISYGVTTDEARHFGLPCGGRLELLVERVDSRSQWRILRDKVNARDTLARRVCLNTGEVSLHPARDATEFLYEADRHLTRVFGPGWQLLVIGASVITRYLVPIARSLGYRVIVCDPREAEIEAWDLKDAELDRGMPDDVVRARADDPRTAVVAVTHDPRLDDMALMEALSSRAFYVGALGSRQNNSKRRERLRSLGLPERAVARLHGPVGLPIGGRTPPEIAVSIAAGLVAARYGQQLATTIDARL